MFGPEVMAFFQVILIDIVLSGDNAVIIGALAASLPEAQRNKAILYGMIAACVMRVVLSLGVAYVLMIPGIMVIGGVLLLYVAYKMYKDLTDNSHLDGSNETHGGKEPKSFRSALWAIAGADLSMSLDNVLGVAGGANGHVPALVFGLVLSVAIMAVGAKLVSGLIDRYKWIAWIGLALILFVAGKMIYEGYPSLVAYFA